jgi:hypothetical protein
MSSLRLGVASGSNAKDRSYSPDTAVITIAFSLSSSLRLSQILFAINRHMQHLGHSIVGDRRYSTSHYGAHGKNVPIEAWSNEGVSHGTIQELMFLWAVQLSLQHPIYDQIVTVAIPTPHEFEQYRLLMDPRHLSEHQSESV